MKTLVVLGDSWPAGIEVPEPHINAFPNKIGKILNFDNVINVSEGRTSLVHFLLQLKKFESIKQVIQTDSHAEYIFLICMTSAVRSLYFDSNGEPK